MTPAPTTRFEKGKTLTYKVAQFEGSNLPPDLQTFMRDAFVAAPRAMDRPEPRGRDGSRLILHRQTHGGMLCGVVSSYTVGAAAPIVDLDSAGDNLRIGSLAPNLEGSARTQFLEGLLYFGIFRNHVIVSQSTRQRVGGFEDHLNWLGESVFGIRDRKRLSIYLADQPPPDKLREIFRAKKVVMRAPLEMSVPDADRGAMPKGGPWQSIVSFMGMGFRGRREMRLPPEVTSGRIQTELSVQWNAETPQDGTPLLDTLATVLRRSDSIDYTIHLDGSKGTITRDQIRLTKPVKVLHHSAEEADMTALFEAMASWLDRLSEEGRIIS